MGGPRGGAGGGAMRRAMGPMGCTGLIVVNSSAHLLPGNELVLGELSVNWGKYTYTPRYCGVVWSGQSRTGATRRIS